jgi:hypothetical protein
MKVTSPGNFLNWYDTFVDPSLPELPVAYLRDPGACGYMPIALPTESNSFYINSKSGFDFPDFDNLRLGMYRADDDSVVSASLGPLQSHPVSDTRYNIFCTVVIPPARFGIHYFTIYRNSTGEELFRSSYVLVRLDVDELYSTTIFARFRHDRYFYDIRYADIPGFYQQFRLNLNVIDEQVEGDIEQYIETTTGKPRIIQSYEQKSVKIESYYFDRSSHIAAAVLFKHSYLEFNGNRFRLKTAYKSTFSPFSKIYKGEAEVFDETFSSINRC